MESLNLDVQDMYITLPSGIKFIRKSYSKYSNKELETVIAECNTISNVVNVLRIHKCYFNNIKKFILDNKISIDHFSNTYDMTAPIIINKQSYHGMKKKLLANGTLINKCAICNLGTIWNNKPIVLQLDHINGYHYDNTIPNLRILCPNCHSQTSTFGVNNTKRIKEIESEKLSLNTIEDKSDYSSDESITPPTTPKAPKSPKEPKSLKEVKPSTPKSKNTITCNACSKELKRKGKTGLCEKGRDVEGCGNWFSGT